MTLSREQQRKTVAFRPIDGTTLEASAVHEGRISLARYPRGSLRKKSQLTSIGGLLAVSGVTTESAQGLGRITTLLLVLFFLAACSSPRYTYDADGWGDKRTGLDVKR